MKIKLLVAASFFIPALVFAQFPLKINPPVIAETPKANVDIAKPATPVGVKAVPTIPKPTAPVAVKPATVPAKTSAPEAERERVIIPGGYNPVLPGAPNFNGY
jgi:hypothetical protein